MDVLVRTFDRFYPYLWGFVAAIVALVYAGSALRWAVAAEVDLSAFFNSVFDISAIVTAFLFAFFGIAIAPGGGFIEKIFGTKTFSLFVRYIGEALALGAALTLLSIPPMIVAEKMLLAGGVPVFMAIWAFFVLASFSAFYRVVSAFLVWLRADAPSLEHLFH